MGLRYSIIELRVYEFQLLNYGFTGFNYRITGLRVLISELQVYGFYGFMVSNCTVPFVGLIPWALMGQALMGLPGIYVYIYIHIHIYVKGVRYKKVNLGG